MRNLKSFRVAASEMEHACIIEQPSLGSSSAVEGFLFSCSKKAAMPNFTVDQMRTIMETHLSNTGAYRGLI